MNKGVPLRIFLPALCVAIFVCAGGLMVFLSIPLGSDETSARRLKKLSELQEQDRIRLGSYAWVDRARGWVRIPIERAMVLEECKLRSIPPHSVDEAFAPVVETPP